MRPAAGAPSEYSSSFAGGRLLHFNGDAQPPRGHHHEGPSSQILASGRGRCRAASGVTHCQGAKLSDTSDHVQRSVPGRWPDGCDCTCDGRAHARRARPDDPDRECVRCRGLDRCWPRRTRGAGRLYSRCRPLEHTCRQRRDLRFELRPTEGFRTGRTASGQSAVDRVQEERAGGKSQGTHRLAEGERIQGCGGYRGRRLCLADRGDLFPKDHRHALYDGPIPRHRPGLE